MKVLIAVMIIAGLGIHSAACGIHVAAVDELWRDPAKRNKYVWSHAYCSVASAPLRWLTELDK